MATDAKQLTAERPNVEALLQLAVYETECTRKLCHWIKHLESEAAVLREERDGLEEDLVSIRSSHSRLLRAIKAMLGFKNWPDFEGNFIDFVISKLKEARTPTAAGEDVLEFLKKCREQFRDVAENYDCDSACERWDGYCRACDAKKMMVECDEFLSKLQQQTGGGV